MDREELQKCIEGIKSMFSDDMQFEPKDKAVLDREFRKYTAKYLSSEPREVVPYHIGMLAYSYILENGGTSIEAMEYSIKLHNKSVEWLMEVKNFDNYNSVAKQVVDDHKEHPEQIKMLSNGTMDKSALRKTKSFNEQIRKLSKYKQTSDQLEMLKETDQRQQEEIEDLRGSVLTHEEDIAKLRETTGLAGMTPREIVRLMYDNNLPQDQAVKRSGKSIRTVKRWWSEFKSEDENGTFLAP